MVVLTKKTRNSKAYLAQNKRNSYVRSTDNLHQMAKEKRLLKRVTMWNKNGQGIKSLPTADVFDSLHDEDDRDQQGEDLIRKASEKQNHVRQGEHAAAPRPGSHKHKELHSGDRAQSGKA